MNARGATIKSLVTSACLGDEIASKHPHWDRRAQREHYFEGAAGFEIFRNQCISEKAGYTNNGCQDWKLLRCRAAPEARFQGLSHANGIKRQA